MANTPLSLKHRAKSQTNPLGLFLISPSLSSHLVSNIVKPVAKSRAPRRKVRAIVVFRDTRELVRHKVGEMIWFESFLKKISEKIV